MKKIIIIGSGLGGLTAGNLLAKKGHQVTMFESRSIPGGYIGGFCRKGFYFESGAYGIGNSTVIFQAMKELGVLDKITFVKHEPFRFVSADFDGTPATFQDLKHMIYDAYPAEKDRLDRFFTVVDRMHDTFKCVMSKVSMVKKIIPALEMAALFFRYNKLTKMQFAERFFPKGSKLYRLLSHMIGYPEMTTSLLGPYFWGIFNDYWGIKDGMQSWADVLAANFRQLGGNLKLKAPVEKILTKANRAVGVVCHGETYEADYVISACDYKQTFQKLLDPGVVPPKLANKLRQTSVSEGWVFVYLGLNISNDALRRPMQSTHAHGYDLTSDADSNTDSKKSQDVTFFDHCRIELYSPSLQNPRLSPEGKASLVIMAIAPYHWMNNWGNGDRKEYLKLKDRVRETLIRRASLIVPDLPNLIEFQDAATPLTFERYTQNSDGATCAWSWSPHKKFYKNFLTINVKTPINNLLIGSAWANQVGGTSHAIKAGQLCAKIIGNGGDGVTH